MTREAGEGANIQTASQEIPQSRLVPRRRSRAWIIPLLLTLGIAGAIVFQSMRETGPTITITFRDAEGLEPGAGIVLRGIKAGVVRGVKLTDDLERVEVTAQLAPHAEALAVEGSSFWIVRPEVSLQKVRGLDTLLGPRYIGVAPGPQGAEPERVFVGLDVPPEVSPQGSAGEEGGLSIQLVSDRLGGLGIGSAVTYRDIRVGVIQSYGLAPDATGVVLGVKIDPAYAHLVRDNSRFWRAAGVGVDWGLFKGVSVESGSLTGLLEGSVAFATPKRPGEPASEGASFELAPQVDEDWLKWAPELIGAG